ncbi:MAG: EamA family transporter, partial [Pseudomonadota bacterium]
MGSLWGLQFAMLKLAVGGGYSDIDVLLLALVLIAVIYSVVLTLNRQWFVPTIPLGFFLLSIALLGYVVPLWATIAVADEISAGLIALMACLTPVLTVSLALLVRAENVNRQRMMAVGLGFLSILLILIPQLELPDRGVFWWLCLALLVPISAAIENVYVATRWPENINPFQLVAGETIIAVVLV